MAQNVLSASLEHEEKLERLLAVAAEIFAEKGYHHASIRDLSRRAGVSLSGLYYYFSSKEELLFMIQERSLRHVLSKLKEKLEGVERPEERLRVLVLNHIQFFANNPAAMRVLSHEFDALEGDYRRTIRELPASRVLEAVRGDTTRATAYQRRGRHRAAQRRDLGAVRDDELDLCLVSAWQQRAGRPARRAHAPAVRRRLRRPLGTADRRRKTGQLRSAAFG